MQEELQSTISRLLEEVGQLVQQGEREKAYLASLQATILAPDEPRVWYLRSQAAPSAEEQLMCLSRAYSLDSTSPETRKELRTATHRLLKQEPFLAYVYETENYYQVRSGRELLINVPKDRAFETPFLQKKQGFTKPAFAWLSISLIALSLGGVGAVLLAPMTVFQVLRLQAASPARGDRIRLWIVLILSVIIWLIAIPISWLFLIRLYP